MRSTFSKWLFFLLIPFTASQTRETRNKIKYGKELEKRSVRPTEVRLPTIFSVACLPPRIEKSGDDIPNIAESDESKCPRVRYASKLKTITGKRMNKITREEMTRCFSDFLSRIFFFQKSRKEVAAAGNKNKLVYLDRNEKPAKIGQRYFLNT
jgi:hypothetical protein